METKKESIKTVMEPIKMMAFYTKAFGGLNKRKFGLDQNGGAGFTDGKLFLFIEHFTALYHSCVFVIWVVVPSSLNLPLI